MCNLPVGFQLINPLEHCAECGKRIPDNEIEAFRKECNTIEAFEYAPLLEDVDTDYPDVCEDCAEQQAMVTHNERCTWSASP